MTFILAKLQAEGSMAASVFYNYSFRDAFENSFSQNFQKFRQFEGLLLQ